MLDLDAQQILMTTCSFLTELNMVLIGIFAEPRDSVIEPDKFLIETSLTTTPEFPNYQPSSYAFPFSSPGGLWDRLRETVFQRKCHCPQAQQT